MESVGLPYDANLVFLPAAEHLTLFHLLVILVSLIHIPYACLVIGGVLFSTISGAMGMVSRYNTLQKIACDLASLVIGRFWLMVGLGLIPLAAWLLLMPETLYDTDIAIVRYMLVVGALSGAGWVLAYIYQKLVVKSGGVNLMSASLGFGAISLMFGGYFIWTTTHAILLEPEHWTLIRTPLPLLFSWNVIAKFSAFKMMTFAATGIAALFFFFVWQKRQENWKEDQINIVRYGAGALAALGILALPHFLMWDLHTMPTPAKSASIFVLTGAALVLLGICGFALYKVMVLGRYESATSAFVSFWIVIALFLISDQLARGNANREHNRVVQMKAEAYFATLADARGVGGGEPDINEGERVYKRLCVNCHAFAKKVVGPAYIDRLPKYKNDLDTLRVFIKQPWKIDPAYPSMPAPGLKSREVDSVILYLMQEYDKIHGADEREETAAEQPEGEATGE